MEQEPDRSLRPSGPKGAAFSVATFLMIALFASAMGLVAARTSWLAWIEHWSGDLRTAALSERRAMQNDRIVIAAITEETLDAFAYRTPVDRGFLAELVRTLDASGATAIGLDLLFVRPTEPGKDAALVNAIRSARAAVVIAAADARAELSPQQAAYQAQFIRQSRARAGYANVLTGGDQVVRYLAPPLPGGEFTLTFAEALAGRGELRREPPHRLEPFFAWQRSRTSDPLRIDWLLRPRDGSDTFAVVPAHVFTSPARAAVANLVRERIVVVGTMVPDLDRHRTPLPEWEGDDVAGVIVQAQVTAQASERRTIHLVSDGVLAVLLFALALPAVIVAHRSGWRAFSLFSGAASVAVIAIDMAMFHWAREIIPFGSCLVALIVAAVGGALSGPLQTLRSPLRQS